MPNWLWHLRNDDEKDVYVEIQLNGSITLRTCGTSRGQTLAWNEELPMFVLTRPD